LSSWCCKKQVVPHALGKERIQGFSDSHGKARLLDASPLEQQSSILALMQLQTQKEM
jgi:hypothetical protein